MKKRRGRTVAERMAASLRREEAEATGKPLYASYKGMKQALRAAAAQAGYTSFNSYIVDAVKEKFLRDTGKEMTWEKETEE